MRHVSQQGFVTLAINTDSTDYLRLAYLQALNVKATQRVKEFAVIVDQATLAQVTDKHRAVFDHIIPTNRVEGCGPFANEWHAWWLSPYKETIKLESDLLFTRSIDHWWDAFRLQDVCLSHGCKTYQQTAGTSRQYRQVFDDNQLPDTYNGLMYWRYSETSKQFFTLAKDIFENWDTVKAELKNCNDPYPTTDVVYALAAKIMDTPCYNPGLDFINFVHMKSGMQGWSDTQEWAEYCVHERNADMIRINNINQLHPVHYHVKDFATDELIEYYEQRVSGSV
jgi:uncharacterized pyridoxamine 5'-phosphate oxidase family protein